VIQAARAARNGIGLEATIAITDNAGHLKAFTGFDLLE
jgi:hypothetical protein